MNSSANKPNIFPISSINFTSTGSDHNTLRQWSAQRRSPLVLFGKRKIMVKSEEFDEWINKHHTEAYKSKMSRFDDWKGRTLKVMGLLFP